MDQTKNVYGIRGMTIYTDHEEFYRIDPCQERWDPLRGVITYFCLETGSWLAGNKTFFWKVLSGKSRMLLIRTAPTKK
jgi:hypothetical protein